MNDDEAAAVRRILGASSLYRWATAEVRIHAGGWVLFALTALVLGFLLRMSPLAVGVVVIGGPAMVLTIVSLINTMRFERALEDDNLLPRTQRVDVKGEMLFFPFARLRLISRLRKLAVERAREMAADESRQAGSGS